MFFVLSKILDIFLSPLFWAMALIVAGVPFGKAQKRRHLALPLSGVGVLLVFSSDLVSARLWGATPITLKEI